MNLEWRALPLPALYLLSALMAAVLRDHSWRILTAATSVALIVATGIGVHAIGAAWTAIEPHNGGAASVAGTLIALLGWIIGDYSRRYRDGEPGQTRFVAAFLSTLASVSAVVGSRDLVSIIVAWAASSAGLHHLLTFYRDRPAAIVVAHKKFLASRLAETCLIAAAVLLYREWKTVDLDAIATYANATRTLPAAAGVAATLIAAAVLLKCAQLPLHGWLIQVMEAPTPVSALLHAGVVNLGGYVLIRLAPLISAAPMAQTLLVVVGSLTALLAGVVMLTRVTIKVRLAWSTSSQMGLMIMECGLGLYDLALLHLVAHALYKAYAFLSAGDAVRDGIARTMMTGPMPAPPRPTMLRIALALPVAALTISGSALFWHEALSLPAIPWIATVPLACGLATLLWLPGGAPVPDLNRLLAIVFGTQLYLAWHWVIGVHIGIASSASSPILAAWALSCFLVLYVAQAGLALRCRPSLTTGLYRWVYAGFYLDERFTRLTFRLWPARAAARVFRP